MILRWERLAVLYRSQNPCILETTYFRNHYSISFYQWKKFFSGEVGFNNIPFRILYVSPLEIFRNDKLTCSQLLAVGD